MTLDDASKFKRLRHSKRAQRDKEPMRKARAARRYDATQAADRLFRYGSKEWAAYRGVKISRTAYLQL